MCNKTKKKEEAQDVQKQKHLFSLSCRFGFATAQVRSRDGVADAQMRGWVEEVPSSAREDLVRGEVLYSGMDFSPLVPRTRQEAILPLDTRPQAVCLSKRAAPCRCPS